MIEEDVFKKVNVSLQFLHHVYNKSAERYLTTNPYIRNKNFKKILKVLSKFLIFTLKKTIKAFLKAVFYVKVASKLRRPHFCNNDLIISLDSFWDYNTTENLQSMKMKHEVKIVTVIYDLIPLFYPQYCGNEYTKSFCKNVNKQIKISDGIIGISRFVMNDVHRYIDGRKSDADRKNNSKIIDYFYLGSNFRTKKLNKTEKARKFKKDLWDEGDVYLMVGTIEPRKGYDYVLKTFTRMWDEGFNGRLLIAGRIGSKSAEILREIYLSKYLNSKLFLFNDLNDNELLSCYKKSKALVLASFVEGFGLPLVEAIHNDLPVICSDIPVFREIGDKYPSYFSLDSADSLMKVIYSFENNNKIEKNARKNPEGFISWRQSAVSLTRKSLNIYKTLLKDT